MSNARNCFLWQYIQYHDSSTLIGIWVFLFCVHLLPSNTKRIDIHLASRFKYLCNPNKVRPPSYMLVYKSRAHEYSLCFHPYQKNNMEFTKWCILDDQARCSVPLLFHRASQIRGYYSLFKHQSNCRYSWWYYTYIHYGYNIYIYNDCILYIYIYIYTPYIQYLHIFIIYIYISHTHIYIYHHIHTYIHIYNIMYVYIYIYIYHRPTNHQLL